MANDFSGDTHCKALWRFESGALGTDSKGTNTLTPVITPAEDLVDFKEGACCVDFERNDHDRLGADDADLDAGFPLKSGDANKKISICFWFKAEGSVAATFLFAKYQVTAGDKTFAIFHNADSSIMIRMGHTDGDTTEDSTASAVTTDTQWYHVGITWQDSDKAYRIRIWDDTASENFEDTTGNFTNNIVIGDAALGIGDSYTTYISTFDGRLDEMVVFDDILTTDEIDKIRAGIYP